MENQGTEKRRRVVLVPCPLQGHISPMLELGTALHTKGFSITIIHTHFNSPNPSNHPHFEFLPISDGLTDEDLASGDLLLLLLTLNANCEATIRELLGRMMDQEGMRDDDNRTVCVIYDTIMYAAGSAASHLKLPSFILRTFTASAMLAYLAMPRLHQAGYFPLQESMMQELVPGLHPAMRFKDLPMAKSENLRALLQLVPLVFNVRTSSAIIWNTMDCLDPEHTAVAEFQKLDQIPSFSIGPLFKFASASSSSLLEEDTNCIPWLDKQAPDSVLYISLGSLASVDEKEVAEMAWGIANSGQPFLWVIRPGSVRDSDWIELLPEAFEDVIRDRGCIVKWAPQKKVLAHSAVGGFWSHCGWNSILESLSEGVPLICSPSFGDQIVNARYVSHVWKVGLEVGNELERGKMETAVRRLMEDKEGKEIKRRAAALKEEVELCITEGGSSYKSLNDLVEFILSL